MQATQATSRQWLVVELAGQTFGLNIACVREMTAMRDKRIIATPRRQKHIAGMLKLRERVLPVVDLRVLLGMPSMADEVSNLVRLLDDREQDHVNWLKALQTSASEGSAFTLATDPHKCKSGRWYDTLMADSGERRKLTGGDASFERALTEVLREFDAPHQRIHAIAVEVTAAVAAGRVDEATATIERTRSTDLAALLGLFERARACVRANRLPLTVVVQSSGHSLGMLVDALDAVQEIADEDIAPYDQTRLPSELVVGFASLSARGSGQVTTLLDVDKLVERAFG